jgi:hypothetical protein
MSTHSIHNAALQSKSLICVPTELVSDDVASPLDQTSLVRSLLIANSTLLNAKNAVWMLSS